MNAEWLSFLDKSNGTVGVADASLVESQLRAANTSAVVSPLTDSGLILASGPDAANFLHNLLTNDIAGLDAKSARFAGMCTPKGRLIATMLIWKTGDDFLLMLPTDLLASILKKLSMYVLRSKVKLSDVSADFALIGLARPAGVRGTYEEMANFQVTQFADNQVIRLDGQRWVLAMNPLTAIGRWNEFCSGATVVGTEAWQWLEIQAGQPRVVAATQEAFVPQMLNMELPAVAGVSFTKGCYPGQEIVARTQYLGKIKRRMIRVHIAGDDQFHPGASVYSAQTGDQQCGTVVSCARAPEGGFDALICVQSSAIGSGEINLGSPTGPRPLMMGLPYPLDLGTGDSETE
ncbi:MAG: folate-binding protein YgfZ [Rhodocyclaceae bacterium]|nr:folate-binding protein YgfZ [Rhodocyclaceae bacterium]